MYDDTEIAELNDRLGVLQDAVDRSELTAYLGGRFYIHYMVTFRELIEARTRLERLVARREVERKRRAVAAARRRAAVREAEQLQAAS